MAIYKLFPTKDATLYSGFPNMNTGLDSIIETKTDFFKTRDLEIGPDPQSSRFLVQHDLYN